MNEAPSKVCIKCGQDCAGRPRVRDAQNRYMCRACADAASAKAPAETDDVDIGYALAEEQSVATTAAADTASCLGCGVLMPPGAVLCTHCGFDTRVGVAVKTAKGKGGAKRCEKCGYDLSGLKKPKCPECGTAFSLGRNLKAERQRDAAETVKWAYLKPLIMFAIGAGIMLTVSGANEGLDGVVQYAISYAIEVPIGVAVFWLCCLFYMGFDAPMHLTAIRLAGIYAITDVVSLLAGFIPIPIVPLVLVLTVYIGLLMDVLDLDLQDAVILGFITGAAKFYAGVFIVMLLFANQ